MELVRSQVISKVADMQLGVTVVKVNLDAKSVPQAVKPAFDDRTNAGNERDKFIKDAEGFANREKEKALAKAREMEEEALGYQKSIENSVVADAQYMERLLPEYRKYGPSILLREYSDVLLKVVQGATQVAIVTPDQEVRIRIEPRLEPQVKRNKADKHGGH